MIRFASKTEAANIANLHKSTITKGFLSKLGPGFLESLYLFLIKKELVFVHLEESTITGYVSFSYNSSNLMKMFLFKSPDGLVKLFGLMLTSPILIKEVLETFIAPFKLKSVNSSNSKENLPNAELLSISVDSNSQRSGIGKQLLKSLENKFIERGINKYKVIAGVSLESANKFYLKNGFVLASQVTIHGKDLSNIYVKELVF